MGTWLRQGDRAVSIFCRTVVGMRFLCTVYVCLCVLWIQIQTPVRRSLTVVDLAGWVSITCRNGEEKKCRLEKFHVSTTASQIILIMSISFYGLLHFSLVSTFLLLLPVSTEIWNIEVILKHWSLWEWPHW